MRRIATPVAVALVLWLGTAASSRAAAVDYLYLESNAGGSSGGHVALRFGDVVYDYQLGEGHTLRLRRTPADAYRYAARVVGNRTIHAARVELSDERAEVLRRRFNRRYLVSNRSFQVLDALRADRQLLERLQLDASGRGSASPVAGEIVAGAALFDLEAAPTGSAGAVAALRARISDRYGDAFLRERIAAFEGEWARLEFSSDASLPTFGPDRWPDAPILFAERHRDLAQWIAGLRALQGAAPLRAEALRSAAEPSLVLTAAERRALRAFAAALEEALVELANSSRSDGGLALLVGMARLEVVHRSLAADRLLLLDAFPADAARSAIEGAGADPYLAEWDDHASAVFAAARARLAHPRPLGEQDYAWLEESGNRFLELRAGRAEGRAVRFADGPLLPAPAGVVVGLPRPQLHGAAAQQALDVARLREAQAERALRDAFGYDLLVRNCVTELFATMADSLQDGSQQPAPDALAFIPFVSFDWFRRAHDVSRAWEEPSLRRDRLASLYREQRDLFVFARESNTLTSTIYRRHEDDGFFLFFTDDVPVLRPLFGALNVGAGLGQAVYGLWRLPFDAGRNLRAGLAGARDSVPELLFLNIRKGTLRYGPGTPLAAAEPPAT